MRQIQYLFLLVLLVAMAMPGAVQASAPTDQPAAIDCETAQAIDWRESSTRSFTVLYPEPYAPIGQILSANMRGAALDREYARFEALFQTSLSLPVAIRIYPDESAYTCLNTQTEEFQPGLLHTQTGAREIALMGDQIVTRFPAWVQNNHNFIRYELSVLFARQIAGNQVPPGLVQALGHYAQNPAETIAPLRLNAVDWQQPSFGWRDLWDGAGAAPDLSRQLQATSTVAFLVDTYGWPTFLTFLNHLPASQGFGQALSRAYGKDLAALEGEWQAYYPRYFRGRWESHPIYNYDLAPYQQMIRNEQYGEADSQLQGVVTFLEAMRQPQKQEQALRLMGMARTGIEAQTFFARSQRAFQAGDYDEALTLLNQAEQRYAVAGNRFIHLDAINAYRQQIKQVRGLHTQLDDLRGDVQTHWNTFSLAYRLLNLGERFRDLGDTNGYSEVVEMARVVETRQREQYSVVAAGVLLVVIVLIGLLARMMRRSAPPEARL